MSETVESTGEERYMVIGEQADQHRIWHGYLQAVAFNIGNRWL